MIYSVTDAANQECSIPIQPPIYITITSTCPEGNVIATTEAVEYFKQVAMESEGAALDLSNRGSGVCSPEGSFTASATTTDGDFVMEDVEPCLAQAAMLAASTGSMTPLVKEELKYSIQQKRLMEGKDELTVEPTKDQETSQLTPEEEERRIRRRERNKMAAQKCRTKRRERSDELQEESQILEGQNEELRKVIQELEEEKERLRHMLLTHDICPRSCNTKLSACFDDEDDEPQGIREGEGEGEGEGEETQTAWVFEPEDSEEESIVDIAAIVEI